MWITFRSEPRLGSLGLQHIFSKVGFIHQGKGFSFPSMAWIFVFDEPRDPLGWFLDQSLKFSIVKYDMMLDRDLTVVSEPSWLHKN